MRRNKTDPATGRRDGAPRRPEGRDLLTSTGQVSILTSRDRRPPADSTPRHARTVRCTGVEVDGCVVRAVQSEGRRVISYRTFNADTPGGALAAWRKTARGGGRVTVVWSGDGVLYRRLRIDKHAEGDTLAPMIAHAAATELGATWEKYVTAGMKVPTVATDDDDDAGDLTAVASLAVPTVSEIWNALSGLEGAQVVPAPLLWQDDGLHLHIGWSCVTLSHVIDGYPVSFRYLEPGGLEVMGGELSSLTDPPSTVFDAVNELALTKVMPIGRAGEIVSGYLDALIFSLLQTVSSWRQSQNDLPKSVMVSGPGARLPGDQFEHSIANQVGVEVRSDQPPIGGDCSTIPLSDEAASLVALTASWSDQFPPWAVLEDRAGQIARLEAAKRAKRRHRKMAAGAAVAAMVVAATAPIVAADLHLSSERRKLTTAQATYSRYAPYISAADRLREGDGLRAKILSGEADWAAVVETILGSGPPGASPQSVDISTTSSTVTISVSATVPAGGYPQVAAWVAALQADRLEVAVSSVSSSVGSNPSTQLSMTVTGPLGAFRKLTGGGVNG